MKTESIFALLVVAVLAWFGWDYLKKKNPSLSLAGQISQAVGNPAIAETENSNTNGWQIPYAQPTFMPMNSLVGNFPETPESIM